MKIALPTRDGRIDDHFGHCDHYTIVTVEGGKVIATEDMPSPEGCGCKSDIAPQMARIGVRMMLAGNMGNGALNVLNSNGIPGHPRLQRPDRRRPRSLPRRHPQRQPDRLRPPRLRPSLINDRHTT